MKLWLVQMESAVADKAKNLDKIIGYVEQAIDAGVSLIAFPEGALTAYKCGPKTLELGEPVPGPSTQAILDKIKGKDIYVAVGMPELVGTHMYNSAPLLGPKGVCGVWRKISLATAWTPTHIIDDGFYYYPGNKIATFDTDWGKVGLSICRDAMYPEIYRCHAYRGALVSLCMAASSPAYISRFHNTGREVSVRNRMWWGLSNVIGTQEGAVYAGGSCLVNPSGEIVQMASQGKDGREEVVKGEIDLEETRQSRIKGHLEAWRPDIMRQAADIIAGVYDV